jgi:hypothetical protein
VWNTTAGNLLGEFNTNQMVNKMYERPIPPFFFFFFVVKLSLGLKYPRIPDLSQWRRSPAMLG